MFLLTFTTQLSGTVTSKEKRLFSLGTRFPRHFTDTANRVNLYGLVLIQDTGKQTGQTEKKTGTRKS